jgi:hypothetical protein
VITENPTDIVLDTFSLTREVRDRLRAEPNKSALVESLVRGHYGMEPRPAEIGKRGRFRRKETIMEPFGHPKFNENKDRYGAGDGETPCGYCGKPCKEPWKDAVRVRTDLKFAAPDEDLPDGLDQGCFPVGPDCARKLRAAGVPVFTWRDE